jgi:hypothetical protein
MQESSIHPQAPETVKELMEVETSVPPKAFLPKKVYI